MNFKKIILPVFSLISFSSFGQTISADSSYPPPGRLINIGGRKLHLLCSGKGSPTIILVAGGGAFSIDWTLVQNRIDSTTRVCSYDRAGLGWSDEGPADETVEQTVNDLHSLLQKAGEKAPYIFVGASIAGIFIQAYQHQYPNEVAGLVFTNSSNMLGLKTKDTSGLIWDLTEEQIRSTYPMPASIKGPAPIKISEPFDRLPANIQSMRLWMEIKNWAKWDPTKTTGESLLSWRKEFLREFEATDFGKQPPLGKLPVVVVSSGGMANDSLRKYRNGAAARLDFLSSNTIHITATGSGHEVHLYQPDRVVDALKKIVFAIRNKIPLSKVSEVR
jgi:pimeloyl-ACP methyl ester carboxylesterase